MKKVFKNIYEAENFKEKVDKKCCHDFSSPYLIKCSGCQEIICFKHSCVVGKSNKKELVCDICYWEKK